MRNDSHNRLSRARRIIAAVLMFICLPLILPASLSWQSPEAKAPSTTAKKAEKIPDIKPQIPNTPDNDKQVRLRRADKLVQNEYDTFKIVTGNVMFSHGPMLMYCDSAHHYDGTESLDAFGNIKMVQGDTLFVFADELNYRGDTHIAYLYGTDESPVKMINRDVTLTTPEFIYDLYNDYGFYNQGGTLTDKKNRLVSLEGEYIPGTKEANFYTDVVLTSRSDGDTLFIYSDTLYYNTQSHIAKLESPSTIINAQATITTSNGTYNTDSALANLYDRSKVVASTGTTLIGDTLLYDRKLGYGEAYGNMEINDSAHCVILTGDYGYYNELTDSAFATGRALMRNYSQGDTLYMHARYMYSFQRMDTTYLEVPRELPDSVGTPESVVEEIVDAMADNIADTDSVAILKDWTIDTEEPSEPLVLIDTVMRIDTSYVMVAHPRVRFYRNDMQGLCDSMRFEQRDSMLYMIYHPIVWSGERQIFGNEIHLHLNDSTIERAILPDHAMSAEHVEDKFYNQLSGKEMIAYFRDGEMYKLDVNGDVRAIMLPMEKDSTYNKIVNVESSFMTADFQGQEILKMKMWPETSGTVTPLHIARSNLFRLPDFKWYVHLRPTSPEDVMIVPESMDSLMEYREAPPMFNPRPSLRSVISEIGDTIVAEPDTAVINIEEVLTPEEMPEAEQPLPEESNPEEQPAEEQQSEAPQSEAPNPDEPQPFALLPKETILLHNE